MSDQYTIKNKEGVYFLTLTAIEWIDIFTRPSLKDVIVDSLIYCQREKGLVIYAWCLMPSHLHLIAASKVGHDLSGIIRDFKKFTSKKLITLIQSEPESRREWMLNLFAEAGKELKRIKNYKVWQDGNMSKELVTSAMAIQKLEYIHNNPVKDRIVNETSHYVYSSASSYERKPGLIEIEYLY